MKIVAALALAATLLGSAAANEIGVSYEDLARYPDKYEGEMVIVRGQVLKVEYHGKSGALVVNISDEGDSIGRDAYIYFDVIPSAPRLLLGDIVTATGQFLHLRQFTNAVGVEMTWAVINATEIHIDPKHK